MFSKGRDVNKKKKYEQEKQKLRERAKDRTKCFISKRPLPRDADGFLDGNKVIDVRHTSIGMGVAILKEYS